jgi:DNA-binding NtrC family response regulator
VLITGETGQAGLVARALHGGNRNGPQRNVAGSVMRCSDTLFGTSPAYTGAETLRKGMIDRAGEGTLFLGEVDLAGLRR